MTGLSFDSSLHIDGLLGITLDNDEVFLVKIKEVIKSPMDELLMSDENDESNGGEVRAHISGCTTSGLFKGFFKGS